MSDYTEYLEIDPQKWHDLHFETYADGVATFRVFRQYGFLDRSIEEVHYACSEEHWAQLNSLARQSLADVTPEEPWARIARETATVYYRAQLARPVADGGGYAFISGTREHIQTDSLRIQAIFGYARALHQIGQYQVGTHLVQVEQVADREGKYGPMRTYTLEFLDGLVRGSSARITVFSHTTLWRRVPELGKLWCGDFSLKDKWLQLVAAYPLDASAVYWL